MKLNFQRATCMCMLLFCGAMTSPISVTAASSGTERSMIAPQQKQKKQSVRDIVKYIEEHSEYMFVYAEGANRLLDKRIDINLRDKVEGILAEISFCDRIVIQRICIRLCQRCLHILAYFLHTHPVFLRQFPIYLPHAHRNLLRGKNYNRLFFLIISDNIIFFNQNKRYNRSFLSCTELKINTLGGHQNG